MENLGTKLSELQFTILDGMADDYEDLEQLYLHANREFSDEEQANIQFPRIRFHRDLQEMVLNESLLRHQSPVFPETAPKVLSRLARPRR